MFFRLGLWIVGRKSQFPTTCNTSRRYIKPSCEEAGCKSVFNDQRGTSRAICNLQGMSSGTKSGAFDDNTSSSAASSRAKDLFAAWVGQEMCMHGWGCLYASVDEGSDWLGQSLKLSYRQPGWEEHFSVVVRKILHVCRHQLCIGPKSSQDSKLIQVSTCQRCGCLQPEDSVTDGSSVLSCSCHDD